MIRVSQGDGQSADASITDAKNLECWAKDAQAQALRIELADESCFIFPYAHLLFASHQRVENTESLRLLFNTHDVRLSGRNLRGLAAALQKMGVDWIRELPPRYQGLAVPDGAFVEKIEIQELREDVPPPQ
jgi:hypothetical protein